MVGHCPCATAHQMRDSGARAETVRSPRAVQGIAVASQFLGRSTIRPVAGVYNTVCQPRLSYYPQFAMPQPFRDFGERSGRPRRSSPGRRGAQGAAVSSIPHIFTVHGTD